MFSLDYMKMLTKLYSKMAVLFDLSNLQPWQLQVLQENQFSVVKLSRSLNVSQDRARQLFRSFIVTLWRRAFKKGFTVDRKNSRIMLKHTVVVTREKVQ